MTVLARLTICDTCGREPYNADIRPGSTCTIPECSGTFRVYAPESATSQGMSRPPGARLRPRDDIEWHATILYTCPSTECDAVFVLGTQPNDGLCPQCLEHDLERSEWVPRRFVNVETAA